MIEEFPHQPAGLAERGSQFWVQVVNDNELNGAELVLLEAACRTMDLLSRLEAELEGAPLTLSGSMGQTREHPLLSESRQQRALLITLMRQLALPDVDGIQPASTSGRSLARARWGNKPR